MATLPVIAVGWLTDDRCQLEMLSSPQLANHQALFEGGVEIPASRRLSLFGSGSNHTSWPGGSLVRFLLRGCHSVPSALISFLLSIPPLSLSAPLGTLAPVWASQRQVRKSSEMRAHCGVHWREAAEFWVAAGWKSEMVSRKPPGFLKGRC